VIETTHPKTSLRQYLERDLYILPSASLVSKDAIKSVGMFDERLSGYEDDDLFTRLFSAGYASVYLNRPVTKWRIYGSSTSFTPIMAQSRMIYFQKQLELYSDQPGIGMNWSETLSGHVS
jgi:GT2 family glycosyltransferase